MLLVRLVVMAITVFAVVFASVLAVFSVVLAVVLVVVASSSTLGGLGLVNDRKRSGLAASFHGLGNLHSSRLVDVIGLGLVDGLSGRSDSHSGLCLGFGPVWSDCCFLPTAIKSQRSKLDLLVLGLVNGLGGGSDGNSRLSFGFVPSQSASATAALKEDMTYLVSYLVSVL